MTLEITTNLDTEVQRVHTELYSFDWAFVDNLGEYGFPLRSVTEITGKGGVGKSSFMFSVGGIISATKNRKTVLIDLERQNKSTVTTSLSNAGATNLEWLSYEWDDGEQLDEEGNRKKKSAEKKKKTKDDVLDTPEKVLNYVTLCCRRVPAPVIMVDSIAAWKPEAVHEGDFGASNMGIRARLLRQWYDRTFRLLISNPTQTAILMTNHKTQDISAFRPSIQAPIPMVSSGGTSVEFFSTQRIHLKKSFTYSFPDSGGWVVEGRIEKNRDGFGEFSKKMFYVYIQGGEGINKNITAVIDCIMTGLAECSSEKKVTDSATVTMDGQKIGQFRDLIAERNNNDLFLPFHNALKSVSGGVEVVTDTALGE